MALSLPGLPALDNSRRILVGLSLFLLGSLTVWAVANWIVGEQFSTLLYIGLAIVVLLCAVNILNDWRFGLFLCFAWLLFEDLPRKYLGNSMSIYFGKDLLIGITYVSFLFAARRGQVRFFRPRFFFALSLFFWLGFMQVFNFNSPSIWYGLLGLKLYFYYVPLLFVGYALVRNEEDLRRVLVWNLIVGGVISLLGMIQAIVGPQFLNPARLAPEIAQLGHLYRAAPISGVKLLRPDSVFVSDGRFANFLQLMWLLGLGSTGYLVTRVQRGRRYVLLGVALVAGGILLSGSRGALVYAVAATLLLAPAFLRSVPLEHRGAWRKAMSAVRWVSLLVGIVLLVLVYVFPEEFGSRWAFYSETLSPDSPAYEVTRRAWDYPVSEILKAVSTGNWVFGSGIGTASLGVFYVSKFFGAPLPGIGVESGFGCILLEFGFLGPILWFVWSGAVLFSSWKVVRHLRGTPLEPLAASIFWFTFILLLPLTYGGIAAFQNFVMNAYLWLLLGILHRLPDLAAPYLAPSPLAGSVAGR